MYYETNIEKNEIDVLAQKYMEEQSVRIESESESYDLSEEEI